MTNFSQIQHRIAHTDVLSPIEYYVHKDAIDKKDQNEHSNNAQDYLLDTEHYLYENPDKPQHILSHTIEVLHDTGASISMLPSDFDFAWTISVIACTPSAAA
jgi:hypothetical protein